MESFAVDRGHHRFRTSKKRGADLNSARPESERSRDPAAVRDATGSNHRNTHGVRYLGDESHRANQTCAAVQCDYEGKARWKPPQTKSVPRNHGLFHALDMGRAAVE